MHYFVYRTHKSESGVCRYTIDDARGDILEDMSKGMTQYIERGEYFAAARLGARMEVASVMAPIEEYGDYVEYNDKKWHIERCDNVMCTAQHREGDDW